MAKLIFKYTGDFVEDCREASKIELNIPNDFDIHEYKIICMRMASAMGFTDSTIKKSFGVTIDDSNIDIEFRNFLNYESNLSASYEF